AADGFDGRAIRKPVATLGDDQVALRETPSNLDFRGGLEAEADRGAHGGAPCGHHDRSACGCRGRKQRRARNEKRVPVPRRDDPTADRGMEQWPGGRHRQRHAHGDRESGGAERGEQRHHAAGLPDAVPADLGWHPGTDPRARAEWHLRQHVERVRIEQLEEDIPGRHLFAGVVEAIGHQGSERRPQGDVGALAAETSDGSPFLHTESGGPFEHREALQRSFALERHYPRGELAYVYPDVMAGGPAMYAARY